ncbi:MAG: RagB/SusD family nutrient uptake outer membrane protein [Butyricimonas faecihominis]
MNKKIFSIIIGLSCCFSACSDWVDVKTKGSLVPEETENYRYLMNNTENFRWTLSYHDVASDDIDISDPAQQEAIYETNKFIPVYTWADEIYSQSENDDEMNKVYQVIYNCNVVIDEVMDSKNGTNEEKLEIRAEALVHRAEAYLTLVNVYGVPYNAATASTDQGVPLLTTPRVEDFCHVHLSKKCTSRFLKIWMMLSNICPMWQNLISIRVNVLFMRCEQEPTC